jgi:lipoprotein-anchoring transpeptidase ErfK/SrfK
MKHRHLALISLFALAGCNVSVDDDAPADQAAQPDESASPTAGDIGSNWQSREGYEEESTARAPEASESGGLLSVDLPEGVTSQMLGERSKRMIAVQVMLDRSDHSPGVIDGRDGANTARAIRYYREAKGLPASEAIDRELVAALMEEAGGDIFRTYTVTEADASTRFYDVPAGFAQMAQLDHLGYESALEMLAERFHMDQDFLAALNPGADFGKAGTRLVIVSHGDDTIDAEIASVEVRKADSTVVGLDGAGRVVVSYPATIGSSRFPSPSGDMKVNAIAPEPNYTFDPEGREWGPDRTFILPPGPNNPVGGTWIDLEKEGYGIHGSGDPQLVAKQTSHGCVRLTNWDAAALARALEPGIPVRFV